jgi:hypothetical protein
MIWTIGCKENRASSTTEQGSSHVGYESGSLEPVELSDFQREYLIVFALLEIGEVEEDAVAAAASLMSIAHRGNA